MMSVRSHFPGRKQAFWMLEYILEAFCETQSSEVTPLEHDFDQDD